MLPNPDVIDIKQLRRRDLFWRENEAIYGGFFPKGAKSFHNFCTVYRKELESNGALVKTGFGSLVHSDLMHVAIKQKICGLAYVGHYTNKE
ncbi:hypothetical protein ICN35_10100 [Polynucleobacter sp. es-GGE-1]|uniref:hypothetical protein n=1 Tax=Polynucleobacter sp. es-GGE-1 TaxID=1819724 RepID=UPI001C0C1EBA|nr:hypothetical protein [Polynucleobacter sp. es-GGE-1]MBU3635813.1 hypothetical protein [Polynucleobacter sp. es-GGE-1]